MGCLSDSYNRPINYLRVSITDRCNLRCLYCMPPTGVSMRPHEEMLRYEEILQVVRAASELGVTKIRVTGGEPLVRLDIVDFIARMSRIPGIDDLSMTTNGMLLQKYAGDLAKAGLKRVNISLDTLRPDKFERITRLGKIEWVLAGIEAAQKAGLKPVKLNSVVIRGFNDDEITDLVRLTLEKEWHIRFIELMPLSGQAGSCDQASDGGLLESPIDQLGNPDEHTNGRKLVSVAEMRQRIEKEFGPLLPSESVTGNGPARYFTLAGATGTIGFISPVSEHFCFQCNRLRLTADGRLRPCLMSDDEIDLRPILRSGATAEALKDVLAAAIAAKPEKHYLDQPQTNPRKRTMSQIGG
ncbi:MAG: GTP 3',8-cyclase MoaA [Chloroflexi bacterium]|nr:GTP 3',8-cyclase MoaA [Chloroflexota bacterium]